MALDKLFSESIVNRDDHVVLGVKLRPLSLWHATLLELIDSPLWHGKSGVTMTDLRLAVAICSGSWPAYKIPQGWRLLCWSVATRKCRLAVEAAKFSAYIRDFHAPPMLWEKEGQGTKGPQVCPLPQPLDVVAWLVRHGFGEDRSWTMPIGLAHWYYVAIARHRGAEVDLVSPGEQIAIEKVRAKRAAAGGRGSEVGGRMAEAG